MSTVAPNLTEVLRGIDTGSRASVDELIPLVYKDFRRLAASMINRGGREAIQPTELVNEVYLKLVDQTRVEWRGRTHFFAVGAILMRRVLVDQARKRLSQKRGGARIQVTLNEALVLSRARDEDVLAVEEALIELAKLNERHAKVVEMRFFGGLTSEEVAEVLDVSKRTVTKDWTFARAWLRARLGESRPPPLSL